MTSQSTPAMKSARTIASLLLVVVAGAFGGARASPVDDWRKEVAQLHRLAGNDVGKANLEAHRLQAAVPVGATDADRANILNLLARTEVYLCLADVAARHVEEARRFAEAGGDRAGQLEADMTLALNAENQGRFGALVAATTHSMTLLDAVDRPDLVTEAMLRTALMYGRAGAFDASMTLPLQAMDIAQRSHDPVALAFAHEGMAIALVQILRWNEAADHYGQMREAARAAGSRLLEAEALRGMGDVLTPLGRLQEGEALIRSALAMYRSVGAPLYVAQAMASLAANLMTQKRPAEALALLDEVLETYRKNGNRTGLWTTFTSRSDDYLALGRMDEAGADAQRAYDLAADLGAALFESRSAQQMANLAAIRGDFQAAYKLSTESVQMKARADAERAGVRMVDLAQRYRTEAKQREIDRLMLQSERQSVHSRWIWTVLVGSLAILLGSAFFLMRLRRANAKLAAANLQLNRAQQEVQATNANLEHRVAERTLQLQVANKAKGTFLATMSHELRTPLNAILGFSSLMRRSADVTPTQAKRLDIINRSGEHLLALINDVLEMAKIDAGRLKLEIAPFDLGHMVRGVADMMQQRAEEKGLELLFDQSSEFPRYIRGDEARLRQVLVNLVGNAVKFTSRGSVTIRLGVRQAEQPHLLIEVQDTGAGIRPEDKERIFLPFEQLAEASEQKGTGLGLTITRQFVELMGGTISVESSEGQGSLFRVDLPADVVQPDALPPASAGDDRQILGLAPGQPTRRILIAEDQPQNAQLLSRLMDTLGFETRLVEDGERCVEAFGQWHPDLIWMDRQMPKMDGIEATRRIRRLPGGESVKIVAVTALAFKEQRDEMVAAGIDDFIYKPYRFGEIYDCMGRQLGVKFVYGAEPAEAPAAQ